MLLLRAGKVRGRSAAQKGEGKDDFHGCGACDCDRRGVPPREGFVVINRSDEQSQDVGELKKLKIAQEFL